MAVEIRNRKCGNSRVELVVEEWRTLGKCTYQPEFSED